MYYRIFIISVVFLLISLLSCNEQESTRENLNGHFRVDIKKIKKRDHWYEYSLEYPKITDWLKDKKKINEKIRIAAYNILSDFREEANEWCGTNLAISERSTRMDAICTIMENSGNYFSIRWIIYVNWSGSENFSHYFKTLNYNVQEQEFVSVKDFAKAYFPSHEQAAESFRELIYKKHDNPLEDDCNEIWREPKAIEDFSYMNLTDRAVYFIFDEYTLGTFRCGTPEYRIPYEKFK